MANMQDSLRGAMASMFDSLYEEDEALGEDLNFLEEDTDFEEKYSELPSDGGDSSFKTRYYPSCSEPLLTEEEVIELAKASQNGDLSARNKLIERNLLLVNKIAYYYSKVWQLNVEDLIQDGSIGLITAVERFDYTLGYHFSTYATWWIRQGILQGIIRTSRIIRIPSHAENKLLHIYRERAKFSATHYRIPTAMELSKLTGIPEKEIANLQLITSFVSLSMPLNGIEDTRVSEVGNYISDDSLDFENEIEEAELKQIIGEYLPKILSNERDIKIITMRFGLYPSQDKPMTLEQISKQFGLSHERIRQIVMASLRKIRKNKEFCEKIKSFI